MTQLEDILDVDLLVEQEKVGNVRRQIHPAFPELNIANYTEQAAYNREWNEITRMCRGLIWNNDTGEVLARPFPKFFNWDEKEAPRILDDQVMWHWDNKYDGSLGIMYQEPDDGDFKLATRGSFASEQAVLGSYLLDYKMPYPEFERHVNMLESGYTPLFEICGPSNRIVLRYDEDFLQPLGYIHIETGMFVPPAGAQSRTMRDLLGDLSRSNAEGWVVWLSSNSAVKIKQADYVELHRLVSNLTPKEVWRQLRAATYSRYVQQLPDELHDLAESWAGPMLDEFQEIYAQAFIDCQTVKTFSAERKEQAGWIRDWVQPDRRGLVFSLLDSKDITDSIWRLLEPSGVNQRNGSAL